MTKKTPKKNGNRATAALDKYEPAYALCFSRRIAHFLDWAAVHTPGVYYQYNMLVKMAMGYSRTVTMRSDQVEQLRRNLHSIGKSLERYHQRYKITEPGLGVRASTDDDDTARHVLDKRARRLLSAKKSVQNVVDSLDVHKLSAPMRKWVQSDLAPILKLANREDFDIKMLPPAAREDDE